MIQLNPRYEAIFNPDNIDQDCDRIASLMNVEADLGDLGTGSCFRMFEG